MPSSDFSWSPQRQPLCHGTKRKLHKFYEPAESEMMEEKVPSAKKKCVEQEDMDQEMNNMFEVNHNHEQSYDLNSYTNNANCTYLNTEQKPQDDCIDVDGLKNPFTEDNSGHRTNVFVQQTRLTCTVISQHPPLSQEDMIMDLNDETYSTAQIDMYNNEDYALNSMDSDCVPNPQQYNMPTSSGNAGYKDIGSSSSSVKSYCRPYWDTQDIGPYVSDYY